MRDARGPNFLKVVSKVFLVLEAIAGSKKGLGVSELSRQLNQPKATVFRILYTLQKLGYVEKDALTEIYRLTAKIESLSYQDGREVLKRVARPFMERLLTRFEETVNLATIDRNRVLYLEILEGVRNIRMSAIVNTYVPLNSTALGKAILAFLDQDRTGQLLKEGSMAKLTPNTLTSVSAIESHLRKVREKGYAIDNEETEIGARCIGAPIFNAAGNAFAAISVSGPTSHIKGGYAKEIAQAVVDACRKISSQIGFDSAPLAHPRRNQDAAKSQ